MSSLNNNQMRGETAASRQLTWARTNVQNIINYVANI